eukprot:52172-Chlamydomonas_euryale.AAC.1
MHSTTRLASLFSALPTTFNLPKEADALLTAFGRAAAGVEPSVTQPRGTNLWCARGTPMGPPDMLLGRAGEGMRVGGSRVVPDRGMEGWETGRQQDACVRVSEKFSDAL